MKKKPLVVIKKSRAIKPPEVKTLPPRLAEGINLPFTAKPKSKNEAYNDSWRYQ